MDYVIVSQPESIHNNIVVEDHIFVVIGDMIFSLIVKIAVRDDDSNHLFKN